MARRGGKRSGVRGPNSALTEFLRNEGITDAFRRRQQRQQEQEQGVLEEEESQEVEAVNTDETHGRETNLEQVRIGGEDNLEEEEEAQLVKAARRKRRAGRGNGEIGSPNYSDDSDEGYLGGMRDGNGFRHFGEETECVDCGKQFQLSVYTRFDENRKGYLCDACNRNLRQREMYARRNQLSARKRRKKLAQALLERSTIRLPSLQDVCIKRISENISDVEALGDIGQMNMAKLSRILSKNRSLNDSTMNLFLLLNLKSLEFWDCSNVDSDSLSKIVSFCPNLESLTLHMCGQLHNDNLRLYASKLPHLKELSLNGPFLISDQVWQEFFETCGSRLTKFELRNTHRFGNDAFISLLENSGSSLTSLKLSRLDALDSAEVYGLLPHYLQPSKVTHLEISYPSREDSITDDLIISTLSIVGESLVHLNLDGCSELSDKFIDEGLVVFCPSLSHLSLRGLDQLTDLGVASAFQRYGTVNSGGLIFLNLTKCSNLGDRSMYQIFLHSSHTLVELSVNSVYGLSKDFFFQIFTDDSHPYKASLKEKIEARQNNADPATVSQDNCEINYFAKLNFAYLTTLDCGFVRSVDNEVLSLISDHCHKLSIIEAFGCNRCNSKAKTRPDLIVIGRESDTL